MIDKPIPFRTYGELAQYVRAKFDQLGIAIKPGSRLDQMEKAIFGPDGRQRTKIKASDPDFEVALQSGRDLQELAFIFDSLPDHVLADFMPELRKIIRDQPLPQNHNGNSPGRDSQFHLYTAAIAHNAGCTVNSAEPDVICGLGGDDEFGIAAKRSKKLTGLRDRIKEGSRQIARSRKPGLIAIETSLALNPNNDRIQKRLSETEFLSAYHGWLDTFITRNRHAFQQLTDPWWVCGIVFHDQQIRLIDNEWKTAGLTICAQFPAMACADPEKYWRQYRTGLPNRVVLPTIAVPRPRLILPAHL